MILASKFLLADESYIFTAFLSSPKLTILDSIQNRQKNSKITSKGSLCLNFSFIKIRSNFNKRQYIMLLPEVLCVSILGLEISAMRWTSNLLTGIWSTIVRDRCPHLLHSVYHCLSLSSLPGPCPFREW